MSKQQKELEDIVAKARKYYLNSEEIRFSNHYGTARESSYKSVCGTGAILIQVDGRLAMISDTQDLMNIFVSLMRGLDNDGYSLSQIAEAYIKACE